MFQILDPETEVKPHFCNTLQKIMEECIPQWENCMSAADVEAFGASTVEQMRGYFSSLIAGVDMTRCPNEREISGAANAVATSPSTRISPTVPR